MKPPRDLKADGEKARALLTSAFLWQLVAVAKKQVDIATWIEKGGLEAEKFLESVDHGGQHPLLRSWEKRKAENANRPAPNLHELHSRHLVCLMCAALDRAGLKKGAARKLAAKELAATALPNSPSPDAI